MKQFRLRKEPKLTHFLHRTHIFGSINHSILGRNIEPCLEYVKHILNSEAVAETEGEDEDSHQHPHLVRVQGGLRQGVKVSRHRQLGPDLAQTPGGGRV